MVLGLAVAKNVQYYIYIDWIVSVFFPTENQMDLIHETTSVLRHRRLYLRLGSKLSLRHKLLFTSLIYASDLPNSLSRNHTHKINICIRDAAL